MLRDPELILASSPPGAADEWLAEWRRYPAMTAVRNGQLVSYVDERIDRMGPSVIEATGNLCAVIDNARTAPRRRRQPLKASVPGCALRVSCVPRAGRNLFQSGQVTEVSRVFRQREDSNEVHFFDCRFSGVV